MGQHERLEPTLQSEVAAIAGEKGKHDPNHKAVRAGSDPSKVPLGGYKVSGDGQQVRATYG